jgi:Neuraminidase (sialidase)
LWTTSTTNSSAHTIKIYRSLDKGHTWSLLSTPVTGSTGVWEAEFAIDSSGRLVMYYSSEEYKGSGYNQLIAHRISTDGGVTWSGDTIDVGVSDGNVQRPGMPLVVRLPNGSYVMTYEVCGASNCEAFIRTSANGVSWGKASNMGTRIESRLR